MLPLMVNVKNMKCVVIGGGNIAYRKTRSLLEGQAKVTVISPIVCQEMLMLENESKINIVRKRAEVADYYDAYLIIAATDSSQLNKQIAAEANPRQLVNVASDHELGNFHFPAYFNRGKLTLSVSTGGASPILATEIKRQLMDIFDDSFTEYTEYLYKTRQEILQSNLSPSRKKELLRDIINEDFRRMRDPRAFLTGDD
ncbi:precorrin-2 dehydrogenase/sirohydrochlorin ferrochelatase family protein [Cytobacillus kochii]